MNGHYLEDRLRDRIRWLSDYKIYREHKDITDKATVAVYDESPILSFILKLYLLPTIIFNFLVKMRDIYPCRKICKEITIIKDEIDKTKEKYYYGKKVRKTE